MRLRKKLEREAEAELPVEGSRNHGAAGIHEAGLGHEAAGSRCVKEVVAEIGAVGEVKRLEEQLDVEPLLEAEVFGGAQIHLEEIVTTNRVIADFAALTGSEAFSGENSFHRLGIAVLRSVNGKRRRGVQHGRWQVKSVVVRWIVDGHDVRASVATS